MNKKYLFNVERALRRGYYTFLHVGKWELRKNTGMIVEAFIAACEESQIHAVLNLKCDNPYNQGWLFEYSGIEGKHDIKYAKINIMDNGTVYQNMRNLYIDNDFGIYASSGEAWCLPLLESLACGLPCICPSWGGSSEYVQNLPKDLILKKSRKLIANDGMFFKGDRGKWQVPDKIEVRDKIKLLLVEPVKYLKLKNQYMEAVNGFTWNNSVNILESVMRKEGVHNE